MRSLLLLGLLSTQCFAFIPPLTVVYRDTFYRRNQPSTVEVVMRHKINQDGRVYDCQERLVRDRAQYFSLWQCGSDTPVGAFLERGAYNFPGQKIFATQSLLFTQYLLAQTKEGLMNQLMAEQFLRRDQFVQYAPTFKPEGDPRTWNIKENYLKHDDVFLSRLPQGIAIAVTGQESPKKTIYFDRDARGILRFEWQNGPVTRWNFEQFAKFTGGEGYPRKMSFEMGGEVKGTTELLSHKPMVPQAYIEFKNQWQQARSSTNVDFLKTFLSYR